jgi:surface antigen
MRPKVWLLLVILVIVFVAGGLFWKLSSRHRYVPGEPIDSLHGVIVYYNGSVGNVSGRNVAPDGYNLGLKYQCVEFVKRYYYQQLHHKMPDAYGHAKDFFDVGVGDGKINNKRGLLQFTNNSQSRPSVSDLVVFSATSSNPYGHVAIISAVEQNAIEIIQQNPGQLGSSRQTLGLEYVSGKWRIDSKRILGWLRMK